MFCFLKFPVHRSPVCGPSACDCMCVKSLQSCLSLCDPMDCSRQAPLSMGFPRQKYWSGLPCPPPGDLPHPGIKPRSPTCRRILYQPSHQGNPRILQWGSLSLLQRIFPIQESNQGLMHCRQIFYQLSYQGSISIIHHYLLPPHSP